MNLDSITTFPSSQDDTLSGQGIRVAFGSREFFSEFFFRLEQSGIPYAILHGYEEFPERFLSDVDYVVGEGDRPKAADLLATVAREHRWVVVQVRQHELFATYCVAIDPENAESHLKLDVCSHFAKNRCLLVEDTVLLENRRRHSGGFFVPAPACEFIYVLAKALAKNKPLAQVLPRLRELWRLDPSGAQQRFDYLVGETNHSVEHWLADESRPWGELSRAMHARKAYGLGMRMADVVRQVRRSFRPVGLHIAALGPDGAGKSTLMENMERLLAPCFVECRVFKFRPDIFNQIKRQVDPTPHDRPPRSKPVSWAKVVYYFGDWWIGLFKRIVPILRRGGFVLFDRNFDDLAVDQRRYLVQGSEKLALFLRRLLPRAAVTFILEADPNIIHARKPELPVEELERQRQAYRQLAAGDSRLRLVSGEEPAKEVARKVCRDVILFLAYREGSRGIGKAKRHFDVVVASLSLVLFSPLLVVLALLVRFNLGSPVIFSQLRPGLWGEPFRIYKFRTMTDARDADGKLLLDAARLTRFGRLLRSTSLDELPELLNILKGEMSLVGPRPLLMRYLPLYSVEQMRRHEALPGVTGWAQINGRNALTWPRKFELDVWYVLHRSLWLDIKILWLTFWKVITREGINQPGHTTSEPFLGSQELVAKSDK